MAKPLLSVAIITFNEEKNIGRTINSVRDIADEIIVVDSHSTDRTRDIAMSLGARVFEEDWKGFIKQKNSALSKCKGEWILCLDADEEVSGQLKNSILKAIKRPSADGYMINRKLFFCGKLMRFTFQPEWRLRLVRRSAKPEWIGGEPHDVLEISGKVKKLKGDLIHHSYTGITDLIEKTIIYSRASAETYMKLGKKAGLHNLLLNPAWIFLRDYILKLGVLDGSRGLILCGSRAIGTFLKYALLWKLHQVRSRT